MAGEQNRGELRHYISATETGTYTRAAKGISTLGGNLNPQEVTRTYIDDSSNTTTTGYQPEWPVDGNIFDGDTVMDLLHEMAVMRAKGASAQLWMLNVFTWKEGDTVNSKQAYKQQVTWLPDSDGGGDGGGVVTFSGTLRAIGDPIHGEAVITEATTTTPETAAFTAF